MKAYLDIETSYNSDITIIGIFYADGSVRQLIGDEITCKNLLESLNGIETIITYNGNRFDLPVIRNKLGVDLTTHYRCVDLMYECWQRNLYGGLKRVEAQLGIERTSKGIDGWEAMRLWEHYVRHHDQQALGILLQYNRDDVMNLVILEKILQEQFITMQKGDDGSLSTYYFLLPKILFRAKNTNLHSKSIYRE